MAGNAMLSAQQKIERFLDSFQSEIRELTSFHEALCSLKSVLEYYNSKRSSKQTFYPLGGQIEDVADKIVDLVESLIPSADESESPKNERNNPGLIFSGQLLHLKQEITTLIKVQKVEEEKQEPGNPHVVISHSVMERSELVGWEEEVAQLRGWLTADTTKIDVISITGMAGIGKTTLVQKAYSLQSIVDHFDTRIMVTIGPNFRLKEFVLVILDHLGALDTRDGSKDNAELLTYLRSVLERRQRYLIVLDDVWDKKVWYLLDGLLSTGSAGSRIIFTTRLLYLAQYPKISHTLEKRFLNDEDSWTLLRGTVFTNPNTRCNFQLEELGKKIAKNCEGLPLAIVSVGQLLCQAETSAEYWKEVSEDENPLKIGIDDDSPISRSLILSYNMLPQYLRTCFLYMGVFPKSYKIFVSELVRLWVAEGFITKVAEIEDIARKRLDDLISRSVAMVRKQSSTFGQIKTCRIHVVFRNLCISIAQKENFCYILNKYAHIFCEGLHLQQRLCIHNNVMLGIEEVRNAMATISSVHSLLCLGPYHPYPLRMPLDFSLLEVVNALRIRFYTFPHEILKLVRLKYLAITCNGELPKSISELWNLEVLIVSQHLRIKALKDTTEYLPMEIWDLKLLKHLQCMGFDLPDSSTTLEHLLTLSGVSSRSCTEGVLARMRYLRKLGITIVLGYDEEEAFDFWDSIVKQLRYLQTLKCIVLGFNSKVISQVPNFPSSIIKITLSGCKFSWKCMAAICKLRRLKVLKLRGDSFSGSEWKPYEKEPDEKGFPKVEFCQLQYLLLEDLDLKVWVSNVGHFPKLEHLIIRHCYNLHDIPIEFGNIKKLKMIEVNYGRPSLCESTKKVQEIHQQKYDKDQLQVRILSSWDDEKKNAKTRP